MIVQKIEGELVRTYSDRGVYIHGGFPEADYAEAVDPVSAGRTYVETDIPLETSDGMFERLNSIESQIRETQSSVTDTEENMVSTKNRESGSLVFVGNILYRLTENVAKGMAIMENINAVKTTVAEELREISNE